jgi:cysteine-rich repeat protein
MVLVLGSPAGSPAAPQTSPVCGNARVEAPETCDDANARDGDGCSALCRLENRPPDCRGAAASLDELWPPNHRLAPVSIEGLSDPDGDGLAVTVTGVTQDEPLVGTGDGNTCPDATGVGTDVAALRMERSAEGDGRVYRVRFRADDGRGGTCAGVVLVCVRHDQRPGGACGDQGPLVDSTAGAADPCEGGVCDVEDCLPSAEDLEPAACSEDSVPRIVSRRVSRAGDLLARAGAASRRLLAERLGQKAARHLRRSALDATRAATRGRLSTACARALEQRLAASGACTACRSGVE